MNKAYTRINWENEPSDATPLNETNLNRMDAAINEIDTRVVTMNTTKLSVTTANSMVKDVTFDEMTGIFTIEKLSGSKITINTALEKISTNFHFNPTTQKLVLTLIDGTVQEIDLSALITQYEFVDSDTIAFTISSDGKVSASVKNGSITGEKLEPNYLADVTLQANNAKTSADNAKTSEELAYQYAEEARESASQTAKSDAKNITYDNAESGLSATNVKDALDEVAQGSDSALKDGDGNVITETYAKQTDLEKVIDGTTTVAKATSATTATKATQDADGNNIVNTYAKKSSVLSTLTECEASTNDTDIAGASALAELNDSLKTPNYESVTIDEYTTTIYYRKVLNMVELNIVGGSYHIQPESEVILFTLPEEYRPKRGFPIPEGYGKPDVRFYIGGEIILQNHGTEQKGYVAGHCVYLV